MSNTSHSSSPHGFTIVELLIVIVVIGILAAITIVSYGGIQGKANDAAIKSDLKHMGSLIELSKAQSDMMPRNEAELSTIDLEVTKNSYGGHLVDGGTGFKYNALYCSTVAGYRPATFALIASSTSKNVFSYLNGSVDSYPTTSWAGSGWGTICPAILGVAAGNSSSGIWLYENSIWKVWLP